MKAQYPPFHQLNLSEGRKVGRRQNPDEDGSGLREMAGVMQGSTEKKCTQVCEKGKGHVHSSPLFFGPSCLTHCLLGMAVPHRTLQLRQGRAGGNYQFHGFHETQSSTQCLLWQTYFFLSKRSPCSPMIKHVLF